MKLYGIRLRSRRTGEIVEESYFSSRDDRLKYHFELLMNKEHLRFIIELAEMEVKHEQKTA